MQDFLSLCITSCVCCWFWHEGYIGKVLWIDDWWEVGFLPICHLEQFASCWFSRPVSEPRLNVCCRLFSNKTPSLVFTSSSSSSPSRLTSLSSSLSSWLLSLRPHHCYRHHQCYLWGWQHRHSEWSWSSNYICGRWHCQIKMCNIFLHSCKKWFCLWEADFPGVFFWILLEYFSESWSEDHFRF